MNTVGSPAIVVAGYNRVDSLKRILHSIEEAHYVYDDIPLIISLDKSDKTPDLLEIAENFRWEHGRKKIRLFKERQGLRKHILSCGDLSFEYGAVIMLEDDIVVGEDFYQYTKNALEFYEDDERIAGIALYSHKYNGYARKRFEPLHNGYDTFLGQFSVTWGQCWSLRQWKGFKHWYEDNSGGLAEREDIPYQIPNWPSSSWGKYFVYYIVTNNKYYVMPYEAHSTCFADAGQHTGKSNSISQVPIVIGRRNYCFANYEKAEKYDIYMENMEMGRFFDHKYEKEGICSNIFGQKSSFLKCRYMLTTKQLDYKIVENFGLKMYPPELNVIYSISGNDIFLYDSFYESKNNFKSQKARIIDYEMGGLRPRGMIYYLVKYILQKLAK